MTNLDRRSLLRLGATAAAASLTPWLHSEISPAASNIKLTLDTTAAVPIPADFTGLSYETAQLAHPGFFSARNTALVALVKTLGPNGVLRIGGNTSEFAVWTVDGEDTEATENLTPVDPDRPGLPGPHIDKAYNVYPRAIDELKTFLDATGWSLIYGINLPRNTPERAAAEASYVVKKIGSALIALQIGNEPDLYSRNGIRPATFNYADYFAEWHKFATAILAMTPGAPIGGPDGARLNWLEQFVGQPMHLALASGHYYAFGPPSDPASNIDHLLRLGVRNLGQTKAVIAAAAKANVPYRMTEGNSCFLGGKAGVSDVFASTLWGIDYMLGMAQLGAVGINFHGGGQGFYTPIANLAAHSFAPRPLYYAMLFFREFAQQSLVPIELNPADSALTAYASIGPNNSLHIAIINKSHTKNFTVDVPTSSPIGTLSLTAPDVESSDVTFAGSKVDARGAWSPADIKSLNPTDRLVTLTVPHASATLVRFTQPPTKAAGILSQARIILAGALLTLASFASQHAIAQTAHLKSPPPLFLAT